MINEMLDLLDSIAAQPNWIGQNAIRARSYIDVYHVGELPKPALLHNLATIQKIKPHDISLEEFERKLQLDALISKISEAISSA
jgi:hypothetical protein